jgi:leucyl-tRNA synthetase
MPQDSESARQDAEWEKMGVEGVELHLQNVSMSHGKVVSAIRWLAQRREEASRSRDASNREHARVARSAKNAAWAAAIAAIAAMIISIIALFGHHGP